MFRALKRNDFQVFVWHADTLEEGKEFLVAGDKDKLQPKPEEEKQPEEPKEDTNGSSVDQAIDVDDDIVEISNGASNGDKKRPHDEENGNGTAAKKARTEEGGSEVEIMSEVSAEEVTAEQLKKRKLQEEEDDGVVCIE